MFAVGDMHAAMGDGEICFTGVEIAGEVDVRFDVLQGKQATWPVTELHDRWVPHATATDYAEALQLVSEEAAKLLVDEHGFTIEDAFVFLSVACDAGVAQACKPAEGFGTIARFSIPKLDACPGRSANGRRRSPACRAGSRPACSSPSGSRATALTRPSDQWPATPTSWPRPRSSAIASPPSAASTSTAPRLARRAGRTSSGSGSCGTSGASIAACRSSPRTTWCRKNVSVHWSCWSPPGVPNAMYGSPSRSASDGDSVVRGRLPGSSDVG